MISRILVAAAMLAISAAFLLEIVSQFVVAALTDERIAITFNAAPSAFITAPFTDDRIGVNPDVLTKAANYLPNSPRLHLRLAEFETPYGKDDWKSAEFHALRAVELSPHDYRPLLALASVQENKENHPASEQSVRAALRLAPGNLEAHWQIATILLQVGRLTDSLEEFRAAGSGNPAYFRAALDMVWTKSGEKADVVASIAPEDEKAQLALANFLLKKSRVPESAAIFRKIEPNAVLADKESSAYLNSLIAEGHSALAHDLWLNLMMTGKESATALWNGGLECDILLDFAQFDWSIRPSNDAQISIDSNTVHSGRRSLRIDFVGRETTKLNDEITQRVLLRPLARYRLSYYVKSQNLAGPEGPRVVVSGTASEPAPKGTTDWQQRSMEFSPAGESPTVAIKLQPKFSYEDPTSGTVWFDDFELREIR